MFGGGAEHIYIYVCVKDLCMVIYGDIMRCIYSNLEVHGSILDLRHLCHRQNTGDGWRNSIFKQVVRGKYKPKKDIFFAIFCAGLHPCFFLNIKLPFGDIHGASPTHSPKSGWECPHRWRKFLISPDIPQTT